MELLLEATRDLLHQDYRRFAYPQSHALVTALRSIGIPAMISGAGPTVIALVLPIPTEMYLRSRQR